MTDGFRFLGYLSDEVDFIPDDDYRRALDSISFGNPQRAPRVTAYDGRFNPIPFAWPPDRHRRSDVFSRCEALLDLPALRQCHPFPPCPLQ